MTGGPSVRASLGHSDAVQIIHGQSSTKYTYPSDPELQVLFRWARTDAPELLAEYINADSGLFHNLSKRGFDLSKAVSRLEAALEALREAVPAELMESFAQLRLTKSDKKAKGASA